jgi:hypothetical protein
MTIIAIYLIVGFVFIWIPILLRSAFTFILLILFFPAAPFLTAWNIRKEKPLMSKLIFILWGLLYFIIILLGLLT